MIKLISIGGEDDIKAFNDYARITIDVHEIRYMDYHDPTTYVYMYAPYIEWEIARWAEQGCLFVQLIDSQRMIVKKTN